MIKLKGPQIAAAREAIRKAGPAQVETAPVEASDSVVSEQGAEPQEVETADAASESEPKPEIRNAIDAAAHEAATSPLNDTPQPTDAQKEAGNYKVGRVRIQGMDISIENPRGSVRSGTSPDGTAWSNTLHSHYGYLVGTKAADGDNLDVYLTDGAEDAPMVWVIDQKNTDGSFDEHKALIGPLATRPRRVSRPAARRRPQQSKLIEANSSAFSRACRVGA
ncbi:hypothetical protein [Zoogloea sp.]|uniref:hypothetical protein n=1 Tax=Zoogloea sp. TaxID=49181 RepID=UPI001416811B|nr:MAG: hypothetical protein F9K15_22810 [Zoogloea sp.]